MAPPSDIILFHYEFSPYGRRVSWYLALRGMEFAQCMQPPTLPRGDLDALGVKYRRIPVLSIGRDIYCDSRFIIQKLEELYPSGALGASQPEQKALEKLLGDWNLDTGMFTRASTLIPSDMPLLQDPKFIQDRKDFFGRGWNESFWGPKERQEALTHMRNAFEFLETGLLADGRNWILGTEKPLLADIEAVFIFHWLIDLKRALPPSLISSQQFPKVYAWVTRFRQAISSAKASAPKPTTLGGPEAAKCITEADFGEPEGQVDENDPLGLQKGQDVESWPIDTGSAHHDRGRLVALTPREVVIASKTGVNGQEIRIHHPRTKFSIQAVGASVAKI